MRGEKEKRQGEGGRRRDSKFESCPTIIFTLLEFVDSVEEIRDKIGQFFSFFAGKNLDFGVTFYSFGICGFCKFQNGRRPSNSNVEFPQTILIYYTFFPTSYAETAAI